MSEVVHASHQAARIIAAEEAAKAAAGKADKATTYTKEEVDALVVAAKPSDYGQVKEQVSQNAEDVGAIKGKIPEQASSQNQLADKEFVNSSIATNTAFYISDGGRPFQSLADLETYEGVLTNNDYAFVVGRDSVGNTTYTRYKWNEATETWGEEYVLNNSSFTAEQWAAISSGITSALVAKLGALPTAEQLVAQLLAKYEKPSTGIPKTDLAAGVQASLDRADTALQTAPVTSVNSQTGEVLLSADNVDAIPKTAGNHLTNAGCITDYLLSPSLEGGIRIRYSSTNINNHTAYVYRGIAVRRDGVTTDYLFDNSQSGIARLIDIYTAIQQIAPDFTAKEYVLNELCTYNGAVYRCKSAYTATAQSAKPDSDTTHWEAKKVSELFLPLTGGTMTGPLRMDKSVIELKDFTGYKSVLRCATTGGDFYIDGYDDQGTLRYSLVVPQRSGHIALLDSPDFTGTPTAPTPASGDDSTKVATTAFVKAAVDAIYERIANELLRN